MPTHHSPLPPPPRPTKIFFDPFNSSTTGHQRAGNTLSGSTSWRDSRAYKLAHQFKDGSGRGGSQHLSDLVGAGSADFGKDGLKGNVDWKNGASGLRENGCQDIRSLMNGVKKRNTGNFGTDEKNGVKMFERDDAANDGSLDRATLAQEEVLTTANPIGHKSLRPSQRPSEPSSPAIPEPAQIFRSLVLYLNGSTAPLVSDHRLKQLWVQHGGSMSIALGRRTVTHVVLGDTRHCGGGLASGKIQKEVARVRGKGIKYVSAQWVLDCVEKGRRVSEAGYGVVDKKIGGAGQASVRGMFRKATATAGDPAKR